LGSGPVVNNAALRFNRSNDYTANNNISGTGTVTKFGAGTLVLGGTNTYSGATTVNTGTLQVNGTPASGAGTYSIAAGATLGGTGSITSTGALTFVNGTAGNESKLAPGASVGTLTINAPVVLNPFSKLIMELNGSNTAVGGTTNDLVAGVTSLTLAGTLDILDAVPNSFASVTAPSTWTLITYTPGNLTNNGLTIGATPISLPPSVTLVLDLVSQPGKVLLVAVVPEANAVLAIGLVAAGTGAAGFMRRRRRARAAS
jgi:fibronectin-binding autotransporter adhesin